MRKLNTLPNAGNRRLPKCDRLKPKQSTVLGSIKSYFQNNSREQIEKDWAECDKYKNIGPKILLSDFLDIDVSEICDGKSMTQILRETEKNHNPQFPTRYSNIQPDLSWQDPSKLIDKQTTNTDKKIEKSCNSCYLKYSEADCLFKTSCLSNDFKLYIPE